MAGSDLIRSWLDPIIDGQEALLSELRDRTVLVTGASGFVGTWVSALLLRLAERGVPTGLIALARRPKRLRERLEGLLDLSPLEEVPCDLTDPSARLPRADLIVHAAGEVGVEAAPSALEAVLVDAVGRVASHGARTGARRMVLVSSGAVYGPQPEGVGRLEESYGGAPDSCGGDFYGNAKRWAETLALARAQGSGLEVVVARAFAFSGAFLPLEGRFALGQFVRDGLAGGPVRVRGSGRPLRSYLDGADLALWLLAALLRGRGGRSYNVGSPRIVPLIEAARHVAEKCNCAVALFGGPDGAMRYVPSTERAQEELEVIQTVPFEESVERMLIWNGGSLS